MGHRRHSDDCRFGGATALPVPPVGLRPQLVPRCRPPPSAVAPRRDDPAAEVGSRRRADRRPDDPGGAAGGRSGRGASHGDPVERHGGGAAAMDVGGGTVLGGRAALCGGCERAWVGRVHAAGVRGSGQPRQAAQRANQLGSSVADSGVSRERAGEPLRSGVGAAPSVGSAGERADAFGLLPGFRRDSHAHGRVWARVAVVRHAAVGRVREGRLRRRGRAAGRGGGGLREAAPPGADRDARSGNAVGAPGGAPIPERAGCRPARHTAGDGDVVGVSRIADAARRGGGDRDGRWRSGGGAS